MAAALITPWLATAPLIASATPLSGTVDFETLDGQPLSTGPIAGGTITFQNVQGSGVNVTFSGIGLQIRNPFGLPNTNYPDTNVLSTTADAQAITVTFTTGFSADSVSVVNLNSGAQLFAQEVDVIDARAFASQNPNQPPLSQVTSSLSPLGLGGPGIRMVIFSDTGTGYTIDDFSFVGRFDAVTGVPEPGSLVLLGGGLLALAGIAGKFRRQR